MDRDRLSEYQRAIDELKKAVKELGDDSSNWDAAYERVVDALRRCDDRRREFFDLGLRI
jgi:hypothetical protein